MYLSLKWHNTAAPWPFISKVVGAQVWQFWFEKYSKFKIVMLYRSIVTKYVDRVVNCLYFINLFQKLWARRFGSFALKNTPNSKNDVLSWHGNQIRCQRCTLFIFKHFMYLSIKWHVTDAARPFISKVVGADVWQFCFE